MKSIIYLLILVTLVTVSFSSEPAELFKGENKLSACRQHIPLTYKNKDDKEVANKAKELNGQELILLHHNKKTNSTSFKRYYLISEQGKKDVYNYLIEKSNYLAKKEVAVFLKYTEKYDRFYTAVCFDKVLQENPELKKLLVEN